MTSPTRRTVLRTSAAAALLPGALAGCAPEDDATDTDTTPVDTDPALDTDEADPADPPDPVEPPDTDVPADDGLVDLDVDTITQDDRRFPWALCAGAMTPTQVLVTSRALLVDTVHLWIWEETATPGRVRLVHTEEVTPGDAGFLAVDVDGLSPQTEYRYALMILGPQGTPNARSLVGRFRTAPAPGSAPPFTIALSSCNGDATGANAAFGRIAEHDVDVILHLGDMAYNDGATTLDAFRDSWARWMQSPGYRRALAHAGLYVTWDDHEIDNNWDPETVSTAVREAALQAYVEAVPVVTGPGARLWRSWRWGDTAEILVLDSRSERLPTTILNDDTSDDVYLSEEQLTWLLDRLRNSPCQFKIVMTSVPITRMPWFGIAADDRWEGFPGQRDQVLGAIQDEDLRNVWFVGGDFHVNFVGRTEPGATGRLADTWEVAVTSGNINPASLILLPPQFRYSSFQPRTVLMTFDPVRDEVSVRFYNPQSGALDRELVLSQP